MKYIYLCLLVFGFHYNSQAQTKIKSEEAIKHIGETVTVTGKVMDGRFLETSALQPTLINLGAAFPNQHLTIFISKEVRASFPIKPETELIGKTVAVTGKISEYKGKPQIAIKSDKDIILVGDGNLSGKPTEQEIQWALEIEQKIKNNNYTPTAQETAKYQDIAKRL